MRSNAAIGVLASAVLAVTALAGVQPASAAPHEKNNGAKSVKPAPPPPVGGGWQFFVVFEEQPVTYTFETKVDVRVTVTDAFCKGDAFTVLVDGKVVAVTPAVDVGECPGPTETSDPDIAVADPTYSHASFVIKKVKSTVSVVLTTHPFGGGGAYVRFDAEPKK